MPLKSIFFDTSDTLYTSSVFEEAQSRQPIFLLAKRRNLSVTKATALFKETETELGKTSLHVTKVAVMMKLGISRMEMQESLAELEPSRFLHPDPHLNDMLRQLHSLYTLGIITNILDTLLTKILAALVLEKQCFRVIVSVDNTTKSKPDPEPFLKALELSHCRAEQCLYVGDSLTKDMIPAKKVGMKTLWVSPESHHDEHVDAYVPHIYDVMSKIDALARQ